VRSQDFFDMNYQDAFAPADVPVGVLGTIFDSNQDTPLSDLEIQIGWADGFAEPAIVTSVSPGMMTISSARAFHLPVGSGMGYSFGIRETTINGNERVDCRCRSIEK